MILIIFFVFKNERIQACDEKHRKHSLEDVALQYQWFGLKSESEQEIKESSRLRSRQAKNQLIKSDILKINNKKITFKVKASEKGTLFKAISKSDIIKAAGEQLKLEITKEYLKLYKPLKEVGEHQVKLKLSGKQANLIIEVLKNNGKEK